MYQGCTVGIVIPAHNETARLLATLSGIPQLADRIFVVDDASTDGTAVTAAGSRDPRVTVLRHSENRGVGAAIATGYAACLEAGLEIAVVMAGDGQMDPADLPALLAPVVGGQADYAKGNRFHWPGVRKIMPRHRYLGGWCLTWLTRWASGYWRVTDSQCGYTAMHQRALAALPLAALYPRYGYPNDVLIRLGELDARVVETPVRPIYGTGTSQMRITRVAPRILGICLRGWCRRQWRRWTRSAPAAASLPAPVARP